MNILLIGPPGVGKGTQAKRIKNELKLIHISTGELLREEIRKKTKIGLIAKTFINKGEFVPDKTILKIIENKFKQTKNSKGYILDGFPRTLPQAIGLEKILKNINQILNIAINLIADDKILEDRLLKRSTKDNRSDDMPSIIKKRQKIYWRQTAPILKFYESKGILKKINGLGKIDIITSRIIKILK